MRDIIIVEDRLSERERLQKLFESAGYGVTPCETVGEAERTFANGGFRLAVVDIGLDDRSGSYLFHELRKNHEDCKVIIFTGNPSIHLKQRFLREGASDYIVKGSPEAQNESFLARVQSLIGLSGQSEVTGMPLQEFLQKFVKRESHELFLEEGGVTPRCERCSANSFVVVFNHQPQIPPDIAGSVRCEECGEELEPKLG